MAGNFDREWQESLMYKPSKLAEEIDTQKLARTVATLQHAIASALAEAHHKIWPLDQDVEYRVIQRNGKVKVAFSLPFSKEPGYKDA